MTPPNRTMMLEGFGRVLRTGLSTLRDRAASRLAALRFNPSRDDGELRRRYEELIFAVCRKYPGESRHETALRYIREREDAPCSGPYAA